VSATTRHASEGLKRATLHPRVPPVSIEEYRTLEKELFGVDVPEDASVLNITRTWARDPDLWKAMRPFQRHLGRDGKIPHRDHEIVILRIGWHCQAEYEFSQHIVFGKAAGLTDEEIKRVTVGPAAPEWSDWDRTLLEATDELYYDHFISDETWDKLAEQYSVELLIDLTVLIGRYWMVSVVLNTLGVQLEEGRPRFPA
jgi:alkylhydroperoxidase family enzyme